MKKKPAGGKKAGPAVDRPEFARRVLQLLEDEGLEASYDEDDFSMKIPDKGTMFLGNLYDEYCRTPVDLRPALLERLLDVLRGPRLPDDPGEAQALLVPVLRPRLYYEQALGELAAREGGDAKPDFAWRVVGEHLALGIALDLPTVLAETGKKDLARWGMKPAQAFTRARRNLLARSKKPFERLDRKVKAWLSPWRDNLDGARLALPQLLRGLDIAGDPVAVVPNRDALVVAGADDQDALAMLLIAARELGGEGRPISPMPVVLREDGWQAWAPPPDSPLRPLHSAATIGYLAQAYHEQQERLFLDTDSQGEMPFVANVMALNLEDGPATLATWTRGVDTLLPEVDLISFMDLAESDDADTRMVVVPWEAVLATCPDLLAPTPHYPRRWRVREFPDAKSMKTLQASARPMGQGDGGGDDDDRPRKKPRKW